MTKRPFSRIFLASYPIARQTVIIVLVAPIIMNPKLKEAIDLVKSGEKKQAYSLLVEVIKANPEGKDAEIAWLWMSAVVSDPKGKQQCLEKVLVLNPNNDTAKKYLAKIRGLPQPTQVNQTIETHPQHINQSQDVGFSAKRTPGTIDKITKPTNKSSIAPIIGLIIFLCLLTFYCGSCLSTISSRPTERYSGNASPTATPRLPATFTPRSNQVRQPITQTYSGVGRKMDFIHIPEGYDTIRVQMIGNGFSYFQVWTMDEKLIMEDGCEEDDCLFFGQASLAGVTGRVEVVFNSVRQFGSLEGEVWAAEVTLLDQR